MHMLKKILYLNLGISTIFDLLEMLLEEKLAIRGFIVGLMIDWVQVDPGRLIVLVD